MLNTAALLVLWLVASYLMILGVAALVRPERALSFLFGFAQTRRANTIEGLARMAAGAAFVVLSRPMSWSPWGALIGVFLVVSAAALLLFPEAHRRLAPRLVALVRNLMPLLGLASLGLAALLGWLLARA